MANKITETNLRPTDKYVSQLSRYADGSIIYYSNRNLLTFKTYKKKIIPITQQDKYMIIGATYEYRPDKVSALFYGVPDFWWRIMEANNISDIFNFKSGLNIRLPGNIFF